MMKIIDEKGRLFGKINVIDFLVILFLIGLLPMFYFGYEIFTKKPLRVAKELTGPRFEVELVCKLIKLEPEIIKLISVGDREYDLKGEPIGEIIALEEILPYTYELNIGGGKTLIKEDSHFRQVMARIKFIAIAKDNELYYKDKIININSPLIFKTNRYEVAVVPVTVPEFVPFEERYIDLYIDLKDLDNQTLSLISEGDREKDKDGRIIAEILSMGKVDDNSFIFNLGNNNFVRGYDAYKKQIAVKVRLRCQIDNENQIYFKGEKIKYNSPIEFNTDEYRVKGIISQTYDVPPRPLKEKWVSAQVKFSGIIPEIANIVKKGDTEIDVTGNISAKIQSIVSNISSEILVLKENNFITLKHPFYKDLLLWLNLSCVEKEGSYYFKNQCIKIGNSLTFVADTYTITGTIVGIEVQ